METIKIATRGSKLAMAQAELVRKLIENTCVDIKVSILKVSTKGDRNTSDFLYKSGSVGLFTSEVQNALLDGRADIAVHSMKDLPTAGSQELVIAAIPKRENVADALVASEGIASVEDLPAGATVGTSSLRRIAQLKHQRKDLKPVPLRGNVETRVKKVASGQIDAVIVAVAGLNRLGLTDKISAILPPHNFIPAPAQGALAVQIRADDSELAEFLRWLDDEPTQIAVKAERAVLAAMHGGCSIPLGVYAHILDDTITIDSMISDLEGKKYIKRSKTDSLNNAETSAKKLAAELLTAGGQQILDQIRNTQKNLNR